MKPKPERQPSPPSALVPVPHRCPLYGPPPTQEHTSRLLPQGMQTHNSTTRRCTGSKIGLSCIQLSDCHPLNTSILEIPTAPLMCKRTIKEWESPYAFSLDLRTLSLGPWENQLFLAASVHLLHMNIHTQVKNISSLVIKLYLISSMHNPSLSLRVILKKRKC